MVSFTGCRSTNGSKTKRSFGDRLIKPLLNRLGYYGVSEQHGSQEFGKDFVFSELHRLGGMRHYAAQVKHEKRINQGSSVDHLLSQVRQSFASPFRRPDSPRDCHVSAVYVFNSGEITANAKDQLLRELERERYGDNVHFLDGERLQALSEWATLQSDANARTRLIGLRSAIRFITESLEEYSKAGKPKPMPLFIQGIEMYLSEPVNCDDQVIKDLFLLWQHLTLIEGLRQILVKYLHSANVMENESPRLTRASQIALPLAKKLGKESILRSTALDR